MKASVSQVGKTTLSVLRTCGVHIEALVVAVLAVVLAAVVPALAGGGVRLTVDGLVKVVVEWFELIVGGEVQVVTAALTVTGHLAAAHPAQCPLLVLVVGVAALSKLYDGAEWSVVHQPPPTAAAPTLFTIF